MFCPRCGMEHATQDVQFCSRCGLRVTHVNELVAANGDPQVTQNLVKQGGWLRSKLNLRVAAKLFFAFCTFVTFCIIVALEGEEPQALIVPALLFMIGFYVQLYQRLFKKKGAEHAQDLATFSPERMSGYLNPPSPFASPLAKDGIKTSEMIPPPPSVTENTTRKLENR